jgi:hypothetical protein
MLKQTAEVAPVVELAPELRQRLHASLSQYTGLCEQIELLQQLADAEKEQIQAILEEGDVSKIEHEGYNLAIVRGTSSSLDKKRLVALGVSEALIQQATTIKPKKPYVMIRKAGESAGDE